MQQQCNAQLRLKQPAYWNTPSPATEEKLLVHWREHDLAGQLHAARAGKPAYWLLDGPPYANGDAHLGHLLNKVLKDVHARYASACGHQLTWRAGWDCHGLPLELAVEKRHGRQAKDDANAFLQQCRLEATRWKDQQAASMARAGLLCDLDQPWLTMDPAREASTLSLLLEFWQAGLLVERGSIPAPPGTAPVKAVRTRPIWPSKARTRHAAGSSRPSCCTRSRVPCRRFAR